MLDPFLGQLLAQQADFQLIRRRSWPGLGELGQKAGCLLPCYGDPEGRLDQKCLQLLVSDLAEEELLFILHLGHQGLQVARHAGTPVLIVHLRRPIQAGAGSQQVAQPQGAGSATEGARLNVEGDAETVPRSIYQHGMAVPAAQQLPPQAQL